MRGVVERRILAVGLNRRCGAGSGGANDGHAVVAHVAGDRPGCAERATNQLEGRKRRDVGARRGIEDHLRRDAVVTTDAREEVATIPLHDHVLFGVLAADQDVQSVIEELLAPVEASAELFAVAALGDTALNVDFQAVLLLLHDEVDDASDGFRTVDRRHTASDRLNLVDHQRRDGVEVDSRGRGVRERQATAIHQH